MQRLFVLVHSPVVGSVTWQGVADRLRARGERVAVPDLTPALRGGPPYVDAQAAIVQRSAGTEPAILVGHSAAGPLLPALGARLEAAGYVFVDASLPTPGRSWMDTAPGGLAGRLVAMEDDGWLPPWPQWWGDDVLAELVPDENVRRRFVADCAPLPLAMFRERRPEITGWPDAACAYLALSDGYAIDLQRARSLGWPAAELRSHHLAMVTDPDAVADGIRALAGQWG